MLTHLRIRRFKLLDDVEVELGPITVLVGPNNSGKTTAMQAIALWEIGVRRWLEKRAESPSAEQRVGVPINRRDLLPLPVPQAQHLWHDLHIRKGGRDNGKPVTRNVLIEITLAGVTEGRPWSCGLEFDCSNDESLYCRPLRIDDQGTRRAAVPVEASSVRVAFLPPMSGLTSEEPKWEPGRINVLIGEGQTAQVLRNLCYMVFERSPDHSEWNELADLLERMFGVRLDEPEYVPERGEVRMSYRERSGVRLSLSSSGRGLQQVLLLFAYIVSNPRSVLLLDEPDAHLEVLRQREVYRTLCELAASRSCQIVAATHSEVVLGEAADRDLVVAFVGQPHRIDERGRAQVIKSLRDIGYDQYQAAETTGWVLYLEGSTDLQILTVLARKLGHPAAALLEERPFFKAVETNLPQRAREHFFGLREAVKELVGIAIFDRLDKELVRGTPLVELTWRKREIESYLCKRAVLLRYARGGQADDLFAVAESQRRERAMTDAIAQVEGALRTLREADPWGDDCKVSEKFFAPVFEHFFDSLQVENALLKRDYYVLASFLELEDIDPEVSEKLDAIVRVAAGAKPRSS